jgi:hypothetical protein
VKDQDRKSVYIIVCFDDNEMPMEVFAKFPFEQILGRELTVKLLESPLKGDMVCRFEIDISE